MHVIWIHERAANAGGAEHYVRDCAQRLSARGITTTLLYDPCLPSSAEYLAGFDVALPLVAPARQLAELDGDVIYAHRVPAYAEAALANATQPVVRMFHDHQLFCLREHKLTAIGGAICTRAVGAGCYACGGFVQRRGRSIALVGLGGLRARQRRAFSADELVVASKYLAREAIANGVAVEQLTTLPLYAPARIGRAGIGTGIVFVGQLVRGKGVDVLLDAVAQTRTPTTIIGDGPERAALEAQARHAGIQVTFAGRLSHDEVARRMARARAVVMPSRVPETFGLVGVEAMAVGAPVIASLVGGVGEWLAHEVTGLGVPHEDPRALAGAITRITHDDVLAERLGQGARSHHLARFTPEAHVNGLGEIFDAVTRQRVDRARGERA